MKKLSTLAALCICAGLWGCATTDSDSSAMTSPGAVSECGTDCATKCDSPCGDKEAAYGALGEKDCSGKSDCDSVCPMSGEPASLGAVNDSPCSGKAKSDCSSTKTCPSTGKPVATNMGAMSDSPSCASKSACSSKKTSCGNK